MSLDTIRHDVAFYIDKGKPEYAAAFKVSDIKALLAERDALYAALEEALQANNTTFIEEVHHLEFPEKT